MTIKKIAGFIVPVLVVGTIVGSKYIQKQANIEKKEKQAKIVKFLTTVDENGRTPLHKAAYIGNETLVKHLVSKERADVNAKTNTGATPLHDAAAGGNVAVVEFLISEGTDVNAKTNTGATPLHSAAVNQKVEAVQFLVSKGANVNATNNDGKNALDMAKEKGNTEVVEYLSHIQ